jgi:hypothetical protein
MWIATRPSSPLSVIRWPIPVCASVMTNRIADR